MYFRELDDPMFSYVRLFSDGLIFSELGIRFTINNLSACISFVYVYARYVPLTSQSTYPIIVYFLAKYRPLLGHFLENVIFAIPTSSLSIYASTWFQATECNTVNASLLLNLINDNFLIFLTENLPIFNPCLPTKIRKFATPL